MVVARQQQALEPVVEARDAHTVRVAAFADRDRLEDARVLELRERHRRVELARRLVGVFEACDEKVFEVLHSCITILCSVGFDVIRIIVVGKHRVKRYSSFHFPTKKVSFVENHDDRYIAILFHGCHAQQN